MREARLREFDAGVDEPDRDGGVATRLDLPRARRFDVVAGRAGELARVEQSPLFAEARVRRRALRARERLSRRERRRGESKERERTGERELGESAFCIHVLRFVWAGCRTETLRWEDGENRRSPRGIPLGA